MVCVTWFSFLKNQLYGDVNNQSPYRQYNNNPDWLNQMPQETQPKHKGMRAWPSYPQQPQQQQQQQLGQPGYPEYDAVNGASHNWLPQQQPQVPVGMDPGI